MSRSTEPSKKRTVYGRDGGVCHYCGQPAALDVGTVDHVVAVIRGGRDANWNLVWCCVPCNTAKGSQWPTCPCSFCSLAVLEHARLGVRPSALPKPLTYTIGELLPSDRGDGP